MQRAVKRIGRVMLPLGIAAMVAVLLAMALSGMTRGCRPEITGGARDPAGMCQQQSTR